MSRRIHTFADSMLQATRLTTMDSSSLGLPRPDYGGGDSESAGSGGMFSWYLQAQVLHKPKLHADRH